MHRLATFVSNAWLERYIVALTILGGLTLILMATLHPFNFMSVNDLTWQILVNRLDLKLLRPDSWIDIPRNIVLFIPFGLGISSLVHTLGLSARGQLLCVGLIGLATTLTVEALQFLLQLRSPELSDILANTAGVLCAYGVYQMWLASDLKRRIPHPNGVQTWLVMTPLLFFAFISLIPLDLIFEGQRESVLTNWDSSYRLALGNEVTGGRPWRGRVYELIVLDRAAKPNEVATYLQSSAIPAEGPAGTVTHYCIVCDDGMRDLSGSSPSLVRRTLDKGDDLIGPVAQDATWLVTATPVANLSKRIAATSEFSVLALIQANDIEQSGPARILTLSKDAFNRNFTLGQEGDELVVRLRTLGTGDNGIRPEFRIPGIFGKNAIHRIAVTYAPPLLRIYVDTVDNSFSAHLAPEIAVVNHLIPNSSWHVTMQPSSLAVYSAIYYLILVESVLPSALIVLALATRLLHVGRRPTPDTVNRFHTIRSDGIS